MRERPAARSRGAGRLGQAEGRGFRILPALGLAAALSSGLIGCGLESVNYYSPPDFAYAGNIITLRHNSSNDDSSFLGYDIYYRAYYTLSEANTARSTIENATNSTTSTPESVLSTMTSGLGFKKMFLASTPTITPTPLLKDGASTYYFYLPSDYSSTNWYYITNADGTTHVEVVRSTGNSSTNSFNESYVVGDADYASTASGVGKKGTVYIDAFAVAYGYDFTKLSSTYSFPASLYQPIGGSNGYTLP